MKEGETVYTITNIFTYLSTFTGIGGFEVALNEFGGECVGYSEINPYSIEIYAARFPSHHNYGDISTIAVDALPRVDMLVGGFPCQPFSSSGRRGGFADTRGTLFFELCRILEGKSPRHFIFENVQGLLTHDDGRTVKTIVAALQELGYCVEWQLLDSRNHGVPQSRPRLYFVGYFGRKPERTVFPFASEDAELLPQRSLRIVGNISRNGRERGDVYASDGLVGCLMASDSKQPKSVMIDGKVRYLTPMEYERLQGFPDGWTIVEKVRGGGMSDRHRYNTCGNAVTVNVVRDIVRRLRENGEL